MGSTPTLLFIEAAESILASSGLRIPLIIILRLRTMQCTMVLLTSKEKTHSLLAPLAWRRHDLNKAPRFHLGLIANSLSINTARPCCHQDLTGSTISTSHTSLSHASLSATLAFLLFLFSSILLLPTHQFD